ncbi:hypothetical protein ABB37_03678 [Leptomonas pyrrhocoris]|uniref:Uncharacterized protein n=1 Tax=Leptomonas pyrrhocoris TaxID=157538 RepID=A0A0M9G2W8_LEPPY|nr:hypothetical protein ABB37_03678 [Leptomonas pyrrhocoris]XP_015659705.1 hypothetical protein ABB37_03678 [Leptomonas pyrrhocoris]XP_015659706.1 hypothetical protein ABB37_03678 [Leptomonas pyrrhocoris]KPA81265.1 hypothetical protein ABB37_03678 [Leptomonas pyrrhocoris]KPA81266.1 hypothetical protein ABB37_03678 [Leptomonas pyrrhocoris]KPA81267.1 hypothetical protein ABB37_03678 [Leptomonas pyrrhocoris]|eukprot:XP_015659704.1 hypothetical protein ABB37_03678 [Leptomonas pyrrhocoris]
MLTIRTPDIFQSYCLAAVAFELPVIVQLLRGDWRLPDASTWFEDEVYYRNNIALTYVFVAFLSVLVIARAMAFFLPNMRLLIIYNLVLHLIELVVFVYCFSHKKGASSASARSTAALVVANVSVFAARFLYLKGKEQEAEVANTKWRREQLAIIRQKRAAYAKEKGDKKNN